MATATTEPAPAATEAPALARLGFEELGRLATGIGGIHRAIADRAFGVSGPGATPARVIHDEVSRRVYGGLRIGVRAAGTAAARALAETQTIPLSATRQGALGLGILNGLIGDQLEREGSPLALPMTLRTVGKRTPRVVVFLHGLMETDESWSLGGRQPYGARLARELGYTAVYVRYNTGRHISENGRELAERLAELHDRWPVAIERIALVGHSMGGLVARSACHQAALADAEWVASVDRIVSLGTPHFGAPLAQAVHWLTGVAGKLPEGAALTAWLRRRSSGIRDLRQGSLVDEDWRDRDPDDLRAVACEEVPLLERATHCFISASITRDADHPLGRMLGDILVLAPSASGRSRRRELGFRPEHGLHVGAANHLALLNHPAVSDQLCRWLAEDIA
jgi:pimeloyl-ACP methyl ester carboxylesterase